MELRLFQMTTSEDAQTFCAQQANRIEVLVAISYAKRFLLTSSLLNLPDEW